MRSEYMNKHLIYVNCNADVYANFNLALCVDANTINELRERFITLGFRCFELDATKVIDASTFVRELVTHLPCDPPYYGFHDEQEVTWAAVEDSLFGGLMDEKSNIVIFWHSAEELIERHLNLVFTGVDILFSIARGGDFIVKMFLSGRGPSFDLHKSS